jgi:hypothetical protein
VIDQTIPFPALVAGMARCVREWILPHVTDPMARAQAELLATLLDALPAAWAADVRDAIGTDSEAARAVLGSFGAPVPAAADAAASVDDLVRENADLKARLQALAEAKRAAGDGEAVTALQRFFLASATDELRLGAGEGTDFASISVKDGAVTPREEPRET